MYSLGNFQLVKDNIMVLVCLLTSNWGIFEIVVLKIKMLCCYPFDIPNKFILYF